MKFFLSASALALISATAAHAGTVVIPYAGSFDEAVVPTEDGLPAGDYDTIGGLDDVALFNLIEGSNSFTGSIFSPTDSSDAFNIGVGAGLRIISASINWGTNLPGIAFSLPAAAGFLQQSTFLNTAPSWFFEESSVTPEIFTISQLEDGALGTTSKLFETGPLDVGPGIYLSSLIDQGSTCAQTYEPNFPGFSPVCVEGLDYTMTFEVESTIAPVPLPAGAPLLLAGVGLLGLLRKRRAA